MTIKQKVDRSANIGIFTLYREGLFFKCYNEDAMIFSTRVKPYKIAAKHVKSAGCLVCSLGFPASTFGKNDLSISSICEAIQAQDYTDQTYGIVFNLKADIKQGYEEFATVLENKLSSDTDASAREIHKVQSEPPNEMLARKIQSYDLANHTPMQAMHFIQELKEIVATKGI
jgi:hypothetical protein